MSRPKIDNPASERIVLRCTVDTKAAIMALAKREGLSVTAYILKRALPEAV